MSLDTNITIDPTIADVSSANVCDEVLRIVASNDDKAAPRAILEAARAPDSPLHALFTWDNNVAAERYRLAQAGALFRQVKLQIVRADAQTQTIAWETVRAVTSVPAERTRANSASYGRTPVVMSDEARRTSVLRGIVRDLVSLRNKYRTYSELHDVWVVIDDAADKFDPPSTRKSAKQSKSASHTAA
jgi:hypothetical protein